MYPTYQGANLSPLLPSAGFVMAIPINLPNPGGFVMAIPINLPNPGGFVMGISVPIPLPDPSGMALERDKQNLLQLREQINEYAQHIEEALSRIDQHGEGADRASEK